MENVESVLKVEAIMDRTKWKIETRWKDWCNREWKMLNREWKMSGMENVESGGHNGQDKVEDRNQVERLV